MSKYVDWTDTFKQDRKSGIEGTLTKPKSSSVVPRRGNKRVLKTSQPSATVSAASKIRRRSATDTDNTRHNSGGNNMPAVKTTKSATKTTARRAAKPKATEPEARETITLALAKMPSGKGGILYNDAAEREEKLHVTSMYFSQQAALEMFGGEVPETLTISA